MTETGAKTVKVWDPLVRVFHWSLVTAFAVAWLTGDEWDDVHEAAGYVVAGLLAFRILWGLVGSRYARFGQFLRGPQAVWQYLKAVVAGQEKRFIGHNPAGGAMIVALLLALAGVCLTGWMYTTDRFWGVEWVEETHEFLANGLLALVALHLAGVVLASVRHRENLARSMLTGYKRAPDADDQA
ncbi:cytochrome b/b6 domain-containing protein [Marinobacteraceae bacterium S3BR75-40.1]